MPLRRKERRKPLPRLCQDCQAVLPQSARVCPECGKVREVRTEIEHRRRRACRAWGEADEAKRRACNRGTRRFHGELRWMASVRGYAPGWAAHKFSERFGVWPNAWQVRTAAPREPSLKTKTGCARVRSPSQSGGRPMGKLSEKLNNRRFRMAFNRDDRKPGQPCPEPFRQAGPRTARNRTVSARGQARREWKAPLHV